MLNNDRYGKAERERAKQIVREVYAQGGEAEENLRAKCRWEQMTPVAVVIEWGDPRTW